jgi:hypothetical protein
MLYLIHKDDQRSYVCDANANAMLDAFRKNGCALMSESQFLHDELEFFPNDKIIVCISFKAQEAYDKLTSLTCEKWLHTIDESKSDGGLYRTQLDFFERVKTNKIINTYPSERNIAFLREHNCDVITFPICGAARTVNYAQKDIDILLSGQMNADYYPVRTRLYSLFSARTRDIVGTVAKLPHSGFSTQGVTHQYHGKNFLELLDRCWIGITCRAGWRDRLVAKYIEFGFSKMLPIGDAPSFMPQHMKISMIDVEHDSDDVIIDKVNALLKDRNALKNRIEIYSRCVSDGYDMDKNVTRVVKMIETGTYEQ